MAQLNFNANEVDPSPVFEVIPAGDYQAIITDSEMKNTKDGHGQYLQFQLQIIDGPYTNRVLFDRLNLVNKNAKAAEIAQRTLSQVCHAVGVLTPGDSAELHNIPMLIHVKFKAANPAKGQDNDQNEVSQYKSLSASAQAPAAVPPAYAAAKPANTGPAPGAAAKVAPPWGAKKAV